MNRHSQYILFIFLFFAWKIAMPMSKHDSLQSRLSTTQDDAEYIRLLNELASELLWKNPTKALDYSIKAEKLSHTNKNISGLIKAYQNIGNIYEDKSKIELALEYYTKSMRIAENSGNAKALATSLNSIGSIYRKQRRFNKALENHNKSLRYLKETGDSIGIAVTNNNLGLIYSEQGKYDKALLNFYNSLRIYESQNNDLGIATSHKNIGLLYKTINNTEQAKLNLERSLVIFEDIKHQSGIAESKLHLGIIYSDEKKYPDAIDALNTCLSIYEEKGDMKGMADSHLELGNIYYYLGKKSLAQQDFAFSLEYYKKINSPIGITNTELKLAKHSFNNGNYIYSNQLLKSTVKLAIQNNLLTQEHEATNLLAEIALKQKNYKNAAFLYSKAKRLSDTLYSRKFITEVSQMQMQHEFEKLEQTYKYEEVKLRLEQIHKVDYLHKVRNILIAFLIIITALVIIIIIEQQKLKNKNKLLSKEKERNKQNVKTLANHKEKLQKANETKNRFLSIIGHDLRNPFNAISNFTSLISSPVSLMNTDELNEYIGIIKESTTSANNLLDNMLEWGLSQDGDFELKIETISLNNIINGNLLLIKEQLRQKNITLKKQLNGTPNITADKNMLNTVIRNLLSNAIKFTPNGGIIKITTTINFKSITIEISDTGIGISPKKLETLFELGIPKKGKGGVMSSGLGLILCVDFLKKHNQKLNVKSKLNEGTHFWFDMEIET